MDFSTTVGIVGLFTTVISLGYAIYVTRASRREKELVFEVLAPAPLAQVIVRETGYSIKILYEQPGQPAEHLDSVFVQYLRFANIGRAPIMRSDIVDRILIRTDGARVLDIAITSTKRPATEIAISPPVRGNGVCITDLTFKFLDHGDGGLIQIVTDGPTRDISLLGAVLGMPSGMRRVTLNDWSRESMWLRAMTTIIPGMVAGFFSVDLLQWGLKVARHFVPDLARQWPLAIDVGIGVVYVAMLAAAGWGLVPLSDKIFTLRDGRLKSAFLKPPGWY